MSIPIMRKPEDGDVVQLRSGGPEMTVEQAMNGDVSRVRYFCEGVGIKQALLRNCCLEVLR